MRKYDRLSALFTILVMLYLISSAGLFLFSQADTDVISSGIAGQLASLAGSCVAGIFPPMLLIIYVKILMMTVTGTPFIAATQSEGLTNSRRLAIGLDLWVKLGLLVIWPWMVIRQIIERASQDPSGIERLSTVGLGLANGTILTGAIIVLGVILMWLCALAVSTANAIRKG